MINMSHEKQTKHIDTVKIGRLEKLDKAVWLIPLIVTVWLLGKNISAMIQIFQASFAEGIITVIAWFILLSIIYIPLTLIARAVVHTLRINAIKATTFDVLQDFEYYRDELTGISPATISMCMDLNIEVEKDISAQFLAYSMKGIVKMEGDFINVLHIDDPGLVSSDHFLLQAAGSGRLNYEAAMQWKQMVMLEIINGRFIRKKERKIAEESGKSGKGKKRFSGIGFMWIVWLVTILIFGGSGMLDELENFFDGCGAASNSEFFYMILGNPQFILPMLLSLGLAILFFYLLFKSFAIVISALVTLKTDSILERTEAGEILTEEIYGLKNFIRDFSNLSHAEKEMLVLWDDFLIYAVLFEENTQIVSDIMNMRNVNLFNIKL